MSGIGNDYKAEEFLFYVRIAFWLEVILFNLLVGAWVIGLIKISFAG